MTTFIPSGNIRGPIIHETVLRLSITAGAKLLYGILCSAANDKDHCWLGLKTMADKLSSGISSIKRYLGELQEAGLISIQHRHGHSSLFTLLPPPGRKSACSAPEQNPASPKSDESVTPPFSGQPNLDSRQPTLNSTQPKTDCINNLNKIIKEISPSSQTPLAQPSVENKLPVGGGNFSDFEKVYSAYPRKEAKGLAKIAWTQLARNKALPQVQVILSAIERFSASHNWQRENGRFIPQLSNFLKGERWNDPIPDEEIKQTAICEESKKIRDSMKQAEERRRLEYENEKLKHQPAFDAFAAKFNGSFHRPMVFGKWLSMHSKHCAPLASDVPDNNPLGIMEFLTEFERKSKVALYNENHQEIFSDNSSHSDEPHKDLPRAMNIRPHSAKELKQPPAVKSGIGMNFSHTSSIHKFMLRNSGNLENRPRGKIQSSRDILFMAMPQANSSALQAATC